MHLFDVSAQQKALDLASKCRPFCGEIERDDGFEGVGQLGGNSLRGGGGKKREDVDAESLTFGGGNHDLVRPACYLNGVRVVDAILQPDRACLAGRPGDIIKSSKDATRKSRTDRCCRQRLSAEWQQSCPPHC